MAKQYLDKLSTLIAKTTSETFQAVSLECKHFFWWGRENWLGAFHNQLKPAVQPATLRAASYRHPSPCPCRPSRRQNRRPQPRSPHVVPKSGASWSDRRLPQTSPSS